MGFKSRVVTRVLAALCITTITGLQAQSAEPFYELKQEYGKCSDDSYEKAVSQGIKLGVSPSMPWTGVDPTSNKAVGIDVDIISEAMKLIGVTKVTFENGPFNSLIPSLLSKRLDLVVTDLHVTPERLKVIAFSGPVWWYGPALVVQTGNPKTIKNFSDLSKAKVGVLLGTAPDEYLRKVGVNATRFQNYAEEFAALQQGKVDVVVEYDLLAAEFKKANPNAGVESVTNFEIPDDLLKNGYGYARFGLRKEDCSLRSALNQALAEMRASGAMSEILRRYGLSDRNLFVFPLSLN